jgi:hypothetical protein
MIAYYAGNPTPHTLYYYGTGTAGKSDIATLPPNSLAYINPDQDEKKQPTEELLQKANVVSAEGEAQKIEIDGDKPFFIPTEFTAQQVVFTKEGTGYQALKLPFDVIEGAKTIPAGEPVMKEGKVEINASSVAIKADTYDVTENGYILTSDGNSVIYAENISPFTYVWDEPNGINDVNGNVNGNGNKGEDAIYDLSGRKVNIQYSIFSSQLKRKGIYIVNGKKIIIK